MSWVVGLFVLLALLVCAELYSMRNTIRELHDEIKELRKRIDNKIRHDYEKELDE